MSKTDAVKATFVMAASAALWALFSYHSVDHLVIGLVGIFVVWMIYVTKR